MNIKNRKLMTSIILATSLFAVSSTPTLAGSTDIKIADVVIMRPAGIAATVIGSVLYVVTLPATYPMGYGAKSLDKLVMEPARYTFTRPIGEDI